MAFKDEFGTISKILFLEGPHKMSEWVIISIKLKISRERVVW